MSSIWQFPWVLKQFFFWNFCHMGKDFGKWETRFDFHCKTFLTFDSWAAAVHEHIKLQLTGFENVLLHVWIFFVLHFQTRLCGFETFKMKVQSRWNIIHVGFCRFYIFFYVFSSQITISGILFLWVYWPLLFYSIEYLAVGFKTKTSRL
jgi:hypothetical protein